MLLVTGSKVLALTIKRCHRMGSHVTRAGWLQGWGGRVWLLGRQEELWNTADRGQVVDPLIGGVKEISRNTILSSESLLSVVEYISIDSDVWKWLEGAFHMEVQIGGFSDYFENHHEILWTPLFSPQLPSLYPPVTNDHCPAQHHGQHPGLQHGGGGWWACLPVGGAGGGAAGVQGGHQDHHPARHRVLLPLLRRC